MAELLERISAAELAEWQAHDFLRWEDSEKQRLQVETNREAERMKRERRY